MPERRSRPIVELTLARLREFLREPDALFWVFAFPVLMALVLGIAFRAQEPPPVSIGVVQTAGADDLLRTFGGANEVRVRALAPGEADGVLRNGEVALLVLPGTPPTYRYDPTRPESHIARLTADNVLQRAAGRQDAWTARDERVVTPGSRYIDWLLPGLLGMNIMGTGLWSIGFGVVLSRVRKLLKRLIATPMPRSAYLLSQMFSRLGFLVLEVSVLLIFGRLVFGVQVHGSLIAVGVLCFLGAFTFAGLGLLLASRAKTIEAMSGLMNLAMLPMWLLSGVFFSSTNFPEVAQPFIQALPLTALVDALRAVMLEGRSLASTSSEMAVLGAWGVVCFALALKLFRWR